MVKDRPFLHLLFVLALVCFYISRLIIDLEILSLFSLSNRLYQLSIFISLICVFINGKKSIEWLCLFFILVPLAFYFFVVYRYNIIASVLLIFAATHIGTDSLSKYLYNTNLWCILITLFLLITGVTTNAVMPRDEMAVSSGSANTMGFQHYSGFSFRIICFTALFLSIYRCHLTWNRILFVVVINVIAFYIATARLQIILSSLMIILFYLSYKRNIIKFRVAAWKYISILAYPLMLVSFYILGALSLTELSFLQELWDENFSGRMKYTVMAFGMYGVTLWGNKIEMVGAREYSESNIDYFYIDAGYAYWLLAYGIIFTLALLYCYSKTFFQSYKNKLLYVYIWMLVFSIGNLINDFFDFFVSYPVLLYLFARTQNKVG